MKLEYYILEQSFRASVLPVNLDFSSTTSDNIDLVDSYSFSNKLTAKKVKYVK